MRVLLVLSVLAVSEGFWLGGKLRSFELQHRFERMPYGAGLVHIHSPEHVSSTHKLSVPRYEILDVGDAVYNERTNTCEIDFWYRNWIFRRMKCRMFTNRLNRSNILFWKSNDELFAYFGFRVEKCGLNQHMFYITFKIYDGIPWFIPNGVLGFMFWMLMRFSVFEDEAKFLGRGPWYEANEKFTGYRRLLHEKF